MGFGGELAIGIVGGAGEVDESRLSLDGIVRKENVGRGSSISILAGLTEAMIPGLKSMEIQFKLSVFPQLHLIKQFNKTVTKHGTQIERNEANQQKGICLTVLAT